MCIKLEIDTSLYYDARSKKRLKNLSNMFWRNTVFWDATVRRRPTEDISSYCIVAVMRLCHCTGDEGMGGSRDKHSVSLNLGTGLD